MSDLRRLHSPLRHIFLRVLSAAGTLLPVLMSLRLAQREGADHRTLIFLGVAALQGWLFWLLWWRSRPLYASATHLVVGRDLEATLVPFSDLVSLGQPWWAFGQWWEIHVLTLRDGSKVRFFAGRGATDFLHRHVRVEA